MKLSTLIPLVIALAALVTQSAVAQAPAPTPNQLVFTETSSTSLSVTYDNTALVVTLSGVSGPEVAWNVMLPAGLAFTIPAVSWIEPENQSLFNNVDFGAQPVANSESTLPIGPIFLDESTLPVGFDPSNGASITVKFDDDGDVATTVPDSGSTFGLLVLALAALFGASRLRSIRLA